MTPDQITAGNILLAKFDGMKTQQLRNKTVWMYNGECEGVSQTYLYFASDLSYHTSFDWIMRVARRFHLVFIYNETGKHIVKYLDYCREIDEILTIYHETPEPIFEKLVEAVEWYNSVK